MIRLDGKRVLIVDDESLIALHAEDILIEHGAVPVGPALSLSEALASIEKRDFDAVLLDVNLNGQSSRPVADWLAAAQIPFVVVTGYGRLGWSDLAPIVLPKPYDAKTVCEALAQVIGERRGPI